LNEFSVDTRHRMFAGIFALSILGVAVALWDISFNEQRAQLPIVGLLAVLFVGAFALIVQKEWSDRHVPVLRPAKVEATPEPEKEAARTRDGELLEAYEEAELQLNPLPPPKSVDAEALNTMETTRILCGVCGDYFEIDLQPTRPLGVDCMACESRLTLRGVRRFEPHTKLYCRYCHDGFNVPKSQQLASFHCGNCGRMNQLRAIGEAPSTAAGAAKGERREIPSRP
jgi:transcription elongation factor Elf1